MEAVASVRSMTTMQKKYYYSEYYYLNAIYQFAAYDQILMCPIQCRDVFSCFLEYFVKEGENIKCQSEHIRNEDVTNIKSFNKFVEETGTFQFVFALSKVNNASFNIEKVLKLINILEQVYNLKPTIVEEIELTIDDDSVYTGTKITADRFSKRTIGYLVTADKWFIQYMHRLSLLTFLFRETCLLFEKDSFEYSEIQKVFLEYFRKQGYDASIEMSKKIVEFFSGVENVTKPVLVDKDFRVPTYKRISDLGIWSKLQ
jgi:hypothetical protein